MSLCMRRGSLKAHTVITPAGTKMAGGHGPGTLPSSSLLFYLFLFIFFKDFF